MGELGISCVYSHIVKTFEIILATYTDLRVVMSEYLNERES